MSQSEADQHLALGAAELVASGRAGVLQHLIGDAQRLEDAHDLVVEVRGPGQRIDLRRLVDGDHLDPGVGEQGGQGGANWPQADDQHLAGQARAHLATSGAQRFSIAPRPSISTRTTSPAFRNRRGFIAAPMPPGVPV